MKENRAKYVTKIEKYENHKLIKDYAMTQLISGNYLFLHKTEIQGEIDQL